MSVGADKSRPLALKTRSTAQTKAVGAAIGKLLPLGACVILNGDLGAGKTQITKGIALALGSKDPVTSPTFNYMHEYAGQAGPVLYHFDLYRINSALQLDDIDYFGYLESGVAVVVEWGSRFPDATPAECLEVELDIAGSGGEEGENELDIMIEAHGRPYELVVERLATATEQLLSQGE